MFANFAQLPMLVLAKRAAIPALVLAVLTARDARAMQQDEAPVETKSFSIQDSRIVKARFDSAQAHIAARRWSEAITDLQKILEENAGDLLSGERPSTAEGRVSEETVYPGAALRARGLLLALPPEAQRLYRDRHEVEAQAALESARARHDLRGLAQTGRRWPLAGAGESAWWAVGDLELEAGHEREAFSAWGRAAALVLRDLSLRLEGVKDWTSVRARIGETPESAKRKAALDRVDFTLAHLGAIDPIERRETMERSMRLPGPREAGGPPPSIEGDAWPAPYTLPRHPLMGRTRSESLFAVRSGDTLFVSTTMRLLALQAYTGEALWDSGEPREWNRVTDSERSKLFDGVDVDSALVAPAASDHVVVAALQLPFAKLDSANFSNIPITRPIPERRLYAFDVDTGRKLWDHAPPPLWNLESGSFTDRMSIGAPPVIVGSRVLVPCILMQGRIDYQVGCFDLETGSLLWSTEVISGQKELNMFGRWEKEFCAAPLRVEGDKVIALTQLGALACLDLFSGEILWETLYNQIEMPRTRQFAAQARSAPWRNCPPVVAGNVVIAIPFDSRDLIAVDLSTGALIWSQNHIPINQLAGQMTGVDLLLGADEDTIFMGGDRIVAIDMPAGLRSPQRLRSKWVFNDREVSSTRFGRPVLGEDRIVIPCARERVEIARTDGRRSASIPWPAGEGGGNLLLGSGEVFSVSAEKVQGMFEWDVLVARARRALALTPRDLNRVLALARLLDGRGSSEWQRGKSEPARAHFAEARTVLEHAIAGQKDDSKTALTAEMHAVLRGESRVRAGLADTGGALNALRDARAFAPDPESLRDTLLEELALMREREGTTSEDAAATRSALDELERACGTLTLLCEARIPADGARPATQMRFAPLIGSRSEEGVFSLEIPVGLWVLLERVSSNERARDSAAEFVDLHAILARYPDVEMPHGTASEIASERIGALLAAGRTQGFAVFEAKASHALDAAIAARDREMLADIARLYPFSAAARRANDARLELALESADVAAVARIVESELSATWNVRTASEREVRGSLRLAAALERAGNRAASAALVRWLARDHGALTSDLPEHQGARIQDLAARAPLIDAVSDTPPPGTFDRELSGEMSLAGEYELLGQIVGVEAPADVAADTPYELVFARRNPEPSRAGVALEIYSSDDSKEPRRIELPGQSPLARVGASTWTQRVALAPGRVVLAMSDGCVGVDVARGVSAWQWRPPGGAAGSLSLVTASGVVIVVSTSRADPDRWSVFALEAQTGAELWHEGPQSAPVGRVPRVSDTRVVFLPAPGHSSAIVRDLFTGTGARALELETTVGSNAGDDAWIEGETLIIPWFNEMRMPERNHIVAIDLETGRRSWRVGFEDEGSEKRTLAAVIQQDKRTWILLRTKPQAERPNEQSLYALDTRIGALTPLFGLRLGPEDRVCGAAQPRGARVRFTPGPLLVISPRATNPRNTSREAKLRCLDLDRGEIWVQSLVVGFDEIQGVLPDPAISLSAVAIAFSSSARAGLPSTQLMSFDRSSGLFGGKLVVRRADKTDQPALIPLGNRLFVRTRSSMEVLR